MSRDGDIRYLGPRLDLRVGHRNGDAVRATLTGQLAQELDDLRDRHVLMVIEFGEEGVAIWIVRRDQNGTPYAHRWPTVPWSALSQKGDLAQVWFRDLIRLGPADRVIYVATSGADDWLKAIPDWLLAVHPTAPIFAEETNVAGQLQDSIRRSPIARWYELVILRSARSGRLRLGRHHLFPPGASSGDRESLTVWCARSDELGTVFAVVCSEAGTFEPKLISVYTAKIPPGGYNVVAELIEPSVVRFSGLPVELQEDHRPWSELVASVPERFDRAESSHMVALIEIIGPVAEVAARLDRLRQLLALLADDWDRPTVISVIAYASHPIGYLEPDMAPRILTWADSPEAGMTAVEGLTRAGPVRSGYLQNAQLECALKEVDRRVDNSGRLAVVTIGDRPPFPPKGEAAALVPCRRRYDWRRAVERLVARPDTVFGLIKEQQAEGELWSVLGRDAWLRLAESDVAHFAAELGITGPADQPQVVFPFLSARS